MYEKQIWENGLDTAGASRLNHMEDGILGAYNQTTNLQTNGEAVKTGLKIDGKDVYMKRIDIGQLPNNTGKTIPMGIDINAYTILNVFGYMYNAGSNYGWAIPTGNGSVFFEFSGSNLIVTTTSDRAKYTGWINILYF